MSEKTISLPSNPGGNGGDANYRLTIMVPKRRFFSYLRDRWWVVLACLALTVGATLTYETIQPETYDSYAQLLLGDVQVNVQNVFSEDSMNYYGTQIELLKSARLQNAAYDAAAVGMVTTARNPMKLQVARPMGTSLLQLQATGSDPALTQRFLQGVIDQYQLDKKESHDKTSEELVTSINEQLKQQKEALESEQNKSVEYEKSNNVVALQEEARGAVGYLAGLKVDLEKLGLECKLFSNTVDSARIAARAADEAATAAEVANASVAAGGKASTNVISATGTAVELRAGTQAAGEPAGSTKQTTDANDAELNATRIELEMLEAEQSIPDRIQALGGPRKYGEAIASLKKKVAFLSDQDLVEKQKQLEDLEKRIAETTAALPRLETNVLEINDRLTEDLRLKNNIGREQAYYESLLKMFQNVDLSRNLQHEHISVWQAPTSARPTLRNLAMRIALAVVGGVALSVGIVFAWQLLDDRFSSFRDVKDQFGEEMLGLVPQIKVRRSKPQEALLQEGDSRYAYRESFRHLRSALLLASGVQKHSQSLLFTGVTPGEGKTTTAVNLARTLARSGLRVALVDADVHVGGIQRLLGKPNEHPPGLLDYLRGEAGMGEILQSTDISRLSYICAGSDDEHAEGLFLLPRLDDLMKRLREEHDFVILDAAPILAADDAAMLVPHADTVVMVVRPFFTHSRQLRQGLGMLYQRQAKQVFLVFNQARPDDLGAKYSRNGRWNVRKNGASKRKTGTPFVVGSTRGGAPAVTLPDDSKGPPSADA